MHLYSVVFAAGLAADLSFIVSEQSLSLPFIALLCFSNHGHSLSFTLSSVAPPPRDAEDTSRKWPQMMDRQEAGSGGQESLIKHETITKSPSPMPEQPSRRPLWQEDDDDLPPMWESTFRTNLPLLKRALTEIMCFHISAWKENECIFSLFSLLQWFP